MFVKIFQQFAGEQIEFVGNYVRVGETRTWNSLSSDSVGAFEILLLI